MRTVLVQARSLLVGVACLTVALGLLQTLLGLRASRAGFPTVVIGLLMSGYFVGYMVASQLAPTLIARVGHLRTFAALAATFAGSTLIHAMVVQGVVWIVLRIIAGFSIAGVFVVAESWLNGRSTSVNRGAVLGAYSVLVFGGMALGQALLNTAQPGDFRLFSLVAVLACAAVIPISLTRQPAGIPDEHPRVSARWILRTAPLALVAAVASGLATGALLTIGAVYGREAGLPRGQISILLAVTLLAGVVAQFPLGRVSDRVDRRLVIAFAALVATASAAAAAFLDAPDAVALLIGLVAIHGACSLPMYSLALAHLQDRLHEHERTGAGGTIVFLQGAGAALGPILASVVLMLGSPPAFLWYLAAVYVVVALYAVYRISGWGPVEVQSPYEPITSGATPVILSLTPEDLALEQQGVAGDLDVDGVRLHYRRIGESGPVIVLVHDLASSSLAWQHQLVAFARAGYVAVAYDLRGHGGSSRSIRCSLPAHVEDLQAVIAQQTDEPVHVVGQGGGAAIALTFAREHPNRTRSLTLVSPVDTLPPRRSVDAAIDHVNRAVELAAWRTVGWTSYARRLAAIVYDPARHPERFALVAADAIRAHPHAVSMTRGAVMRATPQRPLDIGWPILLVIGNRDQGARPSDLARLRGLLGAHELSVLEGAGRFVALDVPDEFEATVLDYVNRADSSLRGSRGGDSNP